MAKKAIVAATLILFLTMLSAGAVCASTDNDIMNLSGGREGYSTAILTDPDKIPVLVIQPQGNTRLENCSFEVRLTNAYWDFDSFRAMGIADYGDVDDNGIFSPVVSNSGYLTMRQSPEGVPYQMEIGDRREVVVVTLDPWYPVSSYDAIYIPLLAEITGNPASVELDDPDANGLSADGALIFSSGAAGTITTQVRPGAVQTFSQTVTLPDLTIQELVSRAMVGGTLTLSAPTGYEWIDIDQIQIAGRNTSGPAITARSFATEGTGARPNPSVLRLELTLNENPNQTRALLLKNLRLSVAEGNDIYGPVPVTLSGCNMERETVRVAERIRVDYTFTADAGDLPKLAAGDYPADAATERIRTLKVTLEESVAGRWRASGRTTFTLPAGITARAVTVNSANLETGLAADTLIRRIDENAYALHTDNGDWTLAANGLTVQNLKPVSGQKARLELTFYIVAEESFRGPVYLTAGGNALTYELSTAIADVVEKAASGSVVLTIGSYDMLVGSERITMDVAPYIEDGYTMVPVSYVARALGLPADGVAWDEETRTVTIHTAQKTAVLTIDVYELAIDGVVVEIAKAPVIRDGRTFLPFRVLGEQILGVAVGWDAQAGEATFY